MRFLLDTSALIRYARRSHQARERIDALIRGHERIGVCPVVPGEFYSGNRVGDRPDFDRMLERFEFWPTTRSAALRASRYRLEARARNVTLALSDILIAAVAVEHNATLLTANPRYFPMPDLRVEPLA